MENDDIFSQLPGALLPWYAQHRRQLPWRQDRDPYHIWVSEVMLQQTRVEAVKGYYSRFLQQLPTVAALANADDALVHKLWEGLGYYSRVRNMKKAAGQIMQRHGGIFPKTHGEVSALAGIGPYTAGAICSIAFGLPTPAVDGNVLRVITRITEDPTPIDSPAFRKQITGQLARIYPPQAGDFTQALMELGATVCGPNRKPECRRCPCKDFCLAHLHDSWDTLPVKKAKAKRRVEEMTVFILSCDGCYGLRKRPEQGLLASLWEFPNVAGKLDVKAALEYVEQNGITVTDIKRQVEKKHIFTHIEWHMSGIYMEVKGKSADLQWMTGEQLTRQAALPTAFRIFWEEAEHV